MFQMCMQFEIDPLDPQGPPSARFASASCTHVSSVAHWSHRLIACACALVAAQASAAPAQLMRQLEGLLHSAEALEVQPTKELASLRQMLTRMADAAPGLAYTA